MNSLLRARLERIATANHPEDVEAAREITFAVCRICGLAEWASSGEPGKGFSVAVRDVNAYPPNECGRCLTAFQRAPELCKWVLGAIAHSNMMNAEKEVEPV